VYFPTDDIIHVVSIRRNHSLFIARTARPPSDLQPKFTEVDMFRKIQIIEKLWFCHDSPGLFYPHTCEDLVRDMTP